MTSFQGQLTTRTLPALLLACLFSNCITAQPDPDRDSQPDNIGTGPYAAMKEEVNTLADHVIYRPQNLAAMGSQKLGLVAWGNGGCSIDGASTRFHLLETGFPRLPGDCQWPYLQRSRCP